MQPLLKKIFLCSLILVLFSCDEDGIIDEIGGNILSGECDQFIASTWELTSTSYNYNGYDNPANCPTGSGTNPVSYPIYSDYNSDGTYSDSGSGTLYGQYYTTETSGTWSCSEDVITIISTSTTTIDGTPHVSNYNGSSTISVDGSSATVTSNMTTNGCTFQSVSYYTVY